MVRKCIICGASQCSTSTDTGLSFHRFPKKTSQRDKWLQVFHLQEEVVSTGTVLCSKHFALDQYESALWPLRRLKENAVPFAIEVDKEAPPKITPPSINLNPTCEPAIEPSIENESLPDYNNSTPSTSNNPGTSSYVRYVGDLKPEHFSSPQSVKRNLQMIQETVDKQRKRIKVLEVTNSRLEKRNLSIKTLFEELRHQHLLSDEASETLQDGIPDTIRQVLDRQKIAKNKKYDADLRAFALTLNFYSPAAYNFVRKQFKDLLPHPETIRQWYKVIGGEPGFTNEAFEAIKLKSENSGTLKVIINLTVDEMSIREMVQWDGEKYHGYVDLGTNFESTGDHTAEATSALVFMAVALNADWKVPLGYFLIKRLNATERANILKTYFMYLNETRVICKSITFDGAPVNIAMCSALGAKYSLTSFQPWFLIGNLKIHTFWDVSHMIKCIRNASADLKILYNEAGEAIMWEYIVKLYELECQEGLKISTKLTARHINFRNEKMKVKLAVQVFSQSVAKALEYCKEINIPGFENCGGTAEFCEIINNCFDILNSRNFVSNSILNRPLSMQNLQYFKRQIFRYINYLKNLKTNLGELIIHSNRKTGFLGMIVSLTSYLNLYDELVETHYLKFILSYKLSQDHLETFFSAVRRRGGHNNNPSALQFKSAYKKLLVRHQIAASGSGNCSILDATAILHVGSGTKERTVDTILINDLEIENVIEEDHDYFASCISLSRVVDDVVQYIAGFVSKKLKAKITCSVCSQQLSISSTTSKLLQIKNRGSLVLASDDIIKICRRLEMLLRQNQHQLTTRRNIRYYLTLKLLRDSNDLFNNAIMNNHIKSQDILENHKVQLIKSTADFYLKVRLHHEAKVRSDKSSSRQRYTQLVLNLHQ